MSYTEVRGVRYAVTATQHVVVVPAPVGPAVVQVAARYNTGGGLDADTLAGVRRRRAVSGRSMWKRSF